MRFLICFICSFFFTACTLPYEKHCLIAKRLTGDFIRNSKGRDGLVADGIGGAMSGDVQTLFVSFEVNRSLTVDEIRVLLVKKAEELIYMMNSDLEIRPFLHDYPCTEKNIQIWISFDREDKKDVTYPHVKYAQLSRGEIHYTLYENEEDWFIAAGPTESYAEALKIVQVY